jgi:hypothetical protein
MCWRRPVHAAEAAATRGGGCYKLLVVLPQRRRRRLLQSTLATATCSGGGVGSNRRRRLPHAAAEAVAPIGAGSCYKRCIGAIGGSDLATMGVRGCCRRRAVSLPWLYGVAADGGRPRYHGCTVLLQTAGGVGTTGWTVMLRPALAGAGCRPEAPWRLGREPGDERVAFSAEGMGVLAFIF